MNNIENIKRSERRTVSTQRASRIQLLFPHETVKVVHAGERSLWTRFLSTFGSKVLCTDERVERTEEVAFEEGWRELRSKNKKARAAYSIEWLYDGSFGVSIQIEYNTGDFSGVHTHEIFPTRKECVEFFLERSRKHFSGNRILPEAQHEARQQMQILLEPSLFGFIEPSPVT